MKIYVACLASYNNGRLHGEWIDADSDADVMREEIARILRESPFPNVTVECPDCEGVDSADCTICKGKGVVPSAEEWAIHDYDGIPSTFSEYPDLQAIADFVELCEEWEGQIDSDDMAAIAAHIGAEYAAEMMRDNFCGIYDSFRDYADESADEMLACHDIKDDNPLARYFDYESFARDLSFDMTTVELPSGKVAVFHS